MAFDKLTGTIIVLVFTMALFGICMHGLAGYASSLTAPPQLWLSSPELSILRGFQAQAVGFQSVPLDELRLIYGAGSVGGEVALFQKAGDGDTQRISPGEILGSGSLIGLTPGSSVSIKVLHKPSGSLLLSTELIARN